MAAPRRLPLIALAAAVVTGAAEARPVTLDGVTFSDELDGLVIVGASGRGTLDDPFVVVEEITGPAAAVLVIRGISPSFGNRVGTLHPTGFALRKIVINRTPFIWTFIDFELQQNLGVSSDYLDGLSFAQGATPNRPFRSDRFDRTSELDEPIDFITFHEGIVRPGETATFDVIITDTTPVPTFYLIQRTNRPISWAGASSNAPASTSRRSRAVRSTCGAGASP